MNKKKSTSLNHYLKQWNSLKIFFILLIKATTSRPAPRSGPSSTTSSTTPPTGTTQTPSTPTASWNPRTPLTPAPSPSWGRTPASSPSASESGCAPAKPWPWASCSYSAAPWSRTSASSSGNRRRAGSWSTCRGLSSAARSTTWSFTSDRSPNSMLAK